MKRFFLFLCVSAIAFGCFGQAIFKAPGITLAPPLAGELYLTSSFGELRPNHFHTGIDLRAREGTPLLACEDGWVSRIGISAGGYGNVLYIDHPNGYTTVYAHMAQFSETIQQYVRTLQYLSESFEQQAFPAKFLLPIKKGQIIGLSGNSGSSTAAHLHFEIRESASEHPINPLYFGFRIPDSVAPSFQAVRLYALDAKSSMKVITLSGAALWAKFGKPLTLAVKESGGQFMLANVSRIEAEGKVGFGIKARDFVVTGGFELDLFQAILEVNGRTTYSFTMNELNFEVNRAINAHVDYPAYAASKTWYSLLYRQPFNPQNTIYGPLVSNGELSILKDSAYAIAISIADFAGQISHLSFNLIGKNLPIEIPGAKESATVHGGIDIPLSFEGYPEFKALIPNGALYGDAEIEKRLLPPTGRALSQAIYGIRASGTPVHLPIEISMQMDTGFKWQDKALIAMQNNAGTQSWALSTVRDGSMLHAKSKTFGSFFMTVDTVSPSIKPLNIADGAYMGSKAGIYFKAVDNFSGVDSFRGTIDGKWVLFQFEGKSSTLWYAWDNQCPRGEHLLSISVWDAVGNQTTQSYRFMR